ncbi:MAG: hypothetical protein QNJ26_13995 [Desulfobacterales bacterium]|nr:hypothetical protein [Desulfobacterales bacterium]
MKTIGSYFAYYIAIVGSIFFLVADARAALMSPGEIDLYRQLGLRLEEKVGNQDALQLHCVVEDPQFLKKLGMTSVERGDKVRLTQEDVDTWVVENETNGSAVSVEATIREIYDHYKPKL